MVGLIRLPATLTEYLFLTVLDVRHAPLASYADWPDPVNAPLIDMDRLGMIVGGALPGLVKLPSTVRTKTIYMPSGLFM